MSFHFQGRVSLRGGSHGAERANMTTEEEARGARKAVTAGVVGNFVEWYEYGVYGYLAYIISQLFFPEGDPAAALLGTYAVFAISFFVRPLGGVLFGRWGDKVGRRTVLAFAILLMSGATFLIGVLPTYATIGFAAPVLLLILRLTQGLAAGGEYVGAVAFVVEYGPSDKRALYASWISVSVFGGLLAGVGIATLLTSTLGDEAMLAGWWRLPFLIALVLGLIGLYLRVKVEETPEFRNLAAREGEIESAPLTEALKTQRKSNVDLCRLRHDECYRLLSVRNLSGDLLPDRGRIERPECPSRQYYRPDRIAAFVAVSRHFV